MPNITRRSFVGATLALAAAGAAHAQGFPDRPVSLVIPYAPGGPTDVVGRIVAEHLGRALKASVVVDNKAGAGGLVAMGQVAKARPDGYTLLLGDMNLAVAPALHKQLAFDPVKDFTPIGMIATAPMVIWVPSASPAKTAQELLAFVKEQNGKLAYASAGIGSPPHLAGEVFKNRFGLNLTHVPFQGSGPALTSLASGQVALMFTGLSAAKPLLEAGKLRALAITGNQRAPELPDVPTLAEAGITLPELSVGSWWGVLAPVDLPQPLAKQLKQALDAALAAPEFKDRLKTLNYLPAPADANFRDWIEHERSTWTSVLHKAGIEPM
jgi:tripartite-type tricarboxylate transporter receptor subunit TctC